MQHFQNKESIRQQRLSSKQMSYINWKPYWTEFSFIACILLVILFLCPISLMPISLSSLSPSPVTLSKLLMFAAWNTSEYLSMLMYWSHSSTDWNSGWGFTSNLERKFEHLLLGIVVKRSYTIYVRLNNQEKEVTIMYSPKKMSDKLPWNKFNYTIT